MSAPIYIPNHVELALLRLVQQYKGKPRIEGLLRGLLADIQSLEDVFFELRSRSLDTSVGVTLDNIGSLVGAVRTAGMSDAEFRIEIKRKIFLNKSQGTPEVLIELTQLLTGATEVQLLEGAIASLQIHIENDVLDQTLIDGLYSALRSSKAAGVRLSGVIALSDDMAFGFNLSDGLGFGDLLDPTVGGKFAKLLLTPEPVPPDDVFVLQLEQNSDGIGTEAGQTLILEIGA